MKGVASDPSPPENTLASEHPAGPAVAEVEAVVAPRPFALTARSWTLYVVPFVRPVITIGEEALSGDRVVHVEPPFVEYS